jgi:hypothetical protein
MNIHVLGEKKIMQRYMMLNILSNHSLKLIKSPLRNA